MTIKYHVEPNLLTTPHSWCLQAVPNRTVGYDEMAADISAAQPVYSAEMIKTLGPLMMKWIQQQLINGDRVTLPESFSFFLSLSGKLDSPDDPLPEDDDMLHVHVRVSRPYTREIQHRGRFERVAAPEKAPVVSSAEDTLFKLNDVLSPAGALLLDGSNLASSPPSAGSVVIAGTRNGSAVQTRLLRVEPSEIMLLPDIPAQDNPWNNEYTLTVKARYSAHGTQRSGTFSRKLRTPLLISGLVHEVGPGLLSGSGDTPLARLTGGVANASELLRVQALVDSRSGQLSLRLLDMREGGRQGAAVTVAAEGEYELMGFSGSAVEFIYITVADLAGLISLAQDNYSSRLVDILDIRVS